MMRGVRKNCLVILLGKFADACCSCTVLILLLFSNIKSFELGDIVAYLIVESFISDALQFV